MSLLHGLNGGVVKYLYASLANALVQVFWSKSLALNVKVCNIELKSGTQGMPHHLLLKASPRHLSTQQLSDYLYLSL
jgi:hypothetical protein